MTPNLIVKHMMCWIKDQLNSVKLLIGPISPVWTMRTVLSMALSLGNQLIEISDR